LTHELALGFSRLRWEMPGTALGAQRDGFIKCAGYLLRVRRDFLTELFPLYYNNDTNNWL